MYIDCQDGRGRSWRLAARLTVLWAATLGVGLSLVAGCGGPSEPPEVIVYTALDQEFSQAIFDEFTEKTGIVVRPKYDLEATKTVGLTQAILAEAANPRCDVFWNNEILNTLRLEKHGLLRPYSSPAAAAFPAAVKSPSGHWHGFAARARVLIVNTNQLPEARRPKSILDLIDPQWYDRCGIAKPLFGTTASHAACLFAVWGEDEAKDYFRSVKRNARIMAGNKQVARAVASGALAFGITDTDDAIVEIENGMPVAIVYPDQGEDGVGTLFIPNTVSLIKGSPNPKPAEQLVDFLLSPEVERKLAAGPSAQIPLNPEVEADVRIETPSTVRAMKVDFEQAAAVWDTAAQFLAGEFAAAE